MIFLLISSRSLLSVLSMPLMARVRILFFFWELESVVLATANHLDESGHEPTVPDGAEGLLSEDSFPQCDRFLNRNMTDEGGLVEIRFFCNHQCSPHSGSTGSRSHRPYQPDQQVDDKVIKLIKIKAVPVPFIPCEGVPQS